MSRRIGPVLRAGPYAAVCTYWPLSRAQWLWWPRREQLPPLLALGWSVEWLCLDWTIWRDE